MTTATTAVRNTDYATISEAAARLGMSRRHLERIIAVNEAKVIGVYRYGRRVVRIHVPTLEAAARAGRVKS